MDRGYRFRWLTGLLVAGLVAAVGLYSYNLGLVHGLAQTAAVEAPGATVPVIPIWRPWGFGFGFFPFFPFLFILFWFFALRGLFWRGRWHRSRWDDGGVPPAFEEWHRQAHARQANESKA
jgi:hypothetical protein